MCLSLQISYNSSVLVVNNNWMYFIYFNKSQYLVPWLCYQDCIVLCILVYIHSYVCEQWFALPSFRSSIKVELLLLPLWVYPIWVFIMYCLTAPELCKKHRSARQIWHLGWGPKLLPPGCIQPQHTRSQGAYDLVHISHWRQEAGRHAWSLSSTIKFGGLIQQQTQEPPQEEIWWLCHCQVVGWSSVKSQVWSCCRCRVHSCVY